MKILKEMKMPRSGMEMEGKVESDYPGPGPYAWISEEKGTGGTSCQDNVLLELGLLWQGNGRFMVVPAPAAIPGSLSWGQRLLGM